MNLSEEEKKAIKKLKNVAKIWPKSLWLFSASGTLCVMKKKDGETVMNSSGSVDDNFVVDYINIENDGGDW